MSSWKEKIERYHDKPPFKSREAAEKAARYNTDEVGMNHPINKSRIKIRDDGAIDVFAGEELGMRIDPNNESINFFCDKFNVWSSETLFHTESDKFMWNYWAFNPEVYQRMPWDFQIYSKHRIWDQHYQMWRYVTRTFNPMLYEEEKWENEEKRLVNDESGIMEEIFEESVEDYGELDTDLEVHPTGDPSITKNRKGIEWR